MHSLNTIIKNNQEACDKHLADATEANKDKVFESNTAQDEALNAIKKS